MNERKILRGVIAGLDPAIQPFCEEIGAPVQPAHDGARVLRRSMP
jgi:hypothetical protein